MITEKTENGVSKLSIEEEMTANTVRWQKEKLLRALAGHNEVEVNLAKVNKLDTAGLQLLLLIKMEAAKAGRKVRIVDYSPAFLDVFNLYHTQHQSGATVRHPSLERAF